MNDEQLLYFSRQILVNQFGIKAQQTLLNSTVLIVGCGGLGCSVAMTLAGSGIGKLILVDDDVVEQSNLPRQILFSEEDIGKAKCEVASNHLTKQFSYSQFIAINQCFDADLWAEKLADNNINLIIDAGDNLALSKALTSIADNQQIPVIHASVIRFEGFVYAYLPSPYSSTHFPSIKTLFPDNSDTETCSSQGVLTVAVTLIANLQATQAIRVLLNTIYSVDAELYLLDGNKLTFNTVKLSN